MVLILIVGGALVQPDRAGAGHRALAGPGISVSPGAGPAGSSTIVSGSGWSSSIPDYPIFWDSIGGTQLGSFSPSGGSFSMSVTVPGSAEPGSHTVIACQGYGTEFQECSSTGFDVVANDTSTPSATFTPSVTPSPTPSPTPTLSECIDTLTIVAPAPPTDGELTDLGGVEEITLGVEVVYGRSEPPQLEFYGNNRYDPITRWPDPLPGTSVDVEMDPSDPHHYSFIISGVPARRGRNEVHVELAATCGRDKVVRTYYNGVPYTPTPRPSVCGGLGLGPDAQIVQFEEGYTPRFREQVRDEYGVLFGRLFETYEVERILPRSGRYVGASVGSAEFGSTIRPIQMTFLRPLRSVGAFVGLERADYVDSQVTASLTVYGYREGDGELVQLGSDATSFPPEPSDVKYCLSFEAAPDDLISKAVLEYRDADGTSLAERRIMDDLTLVFSEAEAAADRPPTVEVVRPKDGAVLESPDLVGRAEIQEDIELVHVWFRVNGGDWQEIPFSAVSSDPMAYLAAASVPTDSLRAFEVNSLAFRVEDSAGQRAEDSIEFRFEPDSPFRLQNMEFSFSQRGPFDQAGFPDRLIAHKTSALRVTGIPQFGGRTVPVSIDEAELHVEWFAGGEQTYRAFHRTSTGFAAGGPFNGEAEFYFLLDGEGLQSGPAQFEFNLRIDGAVIYRQDLGVQRFDEVPPTYLFAVPIADPLRGQFARDFYTEMASMARVYPVRDGAAPYGSPLAESGQVGLIYQVAPSWVPMPNGVDPETGESTYAWDLIQDEADQRARLQTQKTKPFDCNGDGVINDQDLVKSLVASDSPGTTYAVKKYEPRGSLQWNWGAPEDADGDGSISNSDLAKFVVEFYDLDGDEAWHDFAGADRSLFGPDDPYHTYQDSNRNCRMDEGEKATLAPGPRRKDNAWSYMRSTAEQMMDDFVEDHEMDRMAAVAVLPAARVQKFNVVGNCGDSGVCWAAAGRGLTIAHEIGHGWGLAHDSPARFSDGAANLIEWSWVAGPDSRNFMYKNVGDQPRANFAGSDRFSQLSDQAENSWDYYELAAETSGGPGLAAARRFQLAESDRVLTLQGSLKFDGSLQVDRVEVQTGTAPAPPQPGAYELALLDEAGEELNALPFTVVEESTCDGCPFDDEVVQYQRPRISVRVAFPTGAQQIEVRHEGEELAHIDRSAYAPELEWTRSPAGTLDRDQTVELRWQASDRDDVELTYSLAYSSDGGKTYQPIAVHLRSNSYRWDPTSVAGGEQSVLRVEASDGLNVTRAESEPFAVEAGKPTVLILSPDDGSQMAQGSTLIMRAVAVDPEDGALTGDAITWTDEQGDDVGRGTRLILTDLSLGSHTYSVAVSDTNGNTVDASVDLQVTQSGRITGPREVGFIELQASQLDLSAGSCRPSSAHLRADFPTGLGVQRATFIVDAAGLPQPAIQAELEAPGRYSADLSVGTGDPVGEWQVAIVASTTSGEMWSRPLSVHVQPCERLGNAGQPSGNLPRWALAALATIVLGLGLALLAGAGIWWWRRRTPEA